MSKNMILWAGALGFIAVILGALGAHALKEVLGPEQLSSFTTGVRYQAWHAIALLALGLSEAKLPLKKRVSQCWIIGTLLFSISIYFLSLSDVLGIKLSFLGPITPIGGLFMILGWAFLFIGALKYVKS